MERFWSFERSWLEEGNHLSTGTVFWPKLNVRNQSKWFAWVIWVGWINWFEILNSLTFTLSLNVFALRLRFWVGSHAPFTRFASMKKHKSNFKTGFHGTIHTFKNYFTTVFLAKNFQFLAISSIQHHSQMRIVSIFGSPK